MSRLRWLTTGESHGPRLVSVVEGIPAGLPLLAEHVDEHLARRQKGYGRGGRMKIETDRVEFTAGVRNGETLGSPIAMSVVNRDHQSWLDRMGAGPLPGTPEPPDPTATGARRPRGGAQVRPSRSPRHPRARERPRDRVAYGGGRGLSPDARGDRDRRLRPRRRDRRCHGEARPRRHVARGDQGTCARLGSRMHRRRGSGRDARGHPRGGARR